MRLAVTPAGTRAFAFATAFALVATIPATLRAQDISCDRDGAREVRSLEFEGNETFKDDELSARVVTTPSSGMRRFFGWLGVGSARCLPDNGLEPDVANLKAFYKNNGFYETTVDTVVTALNPDRVRVTFRIAEGPPLRADTVAITGLDSVPDRDAVLRGLLVKSGERVGRLQLSTDVDSITARLRNQGYPHATVYPAFTTNLSAQRAEVALDVVTGTRARIGTIDVRRISAHENEAPGIDSSVVLGLLGFQSGNWYSDRALNDASRNLYNLGAYRHVGIEVDTTGGPAVGPRVGVGTDTTTDGADSLVDISVDVREDFLRQVQVEPGWGTLDCFKVDAQYTDKNFLNRAWRMDVTGRASKIGYGSPTDVARSLCYRGQLDPDSIGSSKLNYYAGATVRQPTLFGGHWVPQYAAYTERRGEYRAYLRTTYVGLDISATRNIGQQMPFRLGYTLEFGQTQAEAAVLCAVFNRCNSSDAADIEGLKRFAVASVSLGQTKTDNPVSPRSGFAWATEFRTAAPFTGSDDSLTFSKITADFSVYRPVTSRITFAARARGGFIGGGAGFTNGVLPPPQERLYAGGAQSDRGFRENELGALVYLVNPNDPKQFSFETLDDTTTVIRARQGAKAIRTIPVGGNALFVLNTEMRIRDPFFPNLLEYVPFVDAGQLWTLERGTRAINLDRLIVTPGFGIRYFSPIGPIQLNIGYNNSKTRAGPAYWAAPIDDARAFNAPLLCVTPPGADPVLIRTDQHTGQLLNTIGDCPATFVPHRSSSFLNRLVPTISIGASF
jgi:Outer membrane protein/protective antigen OMA87